MNKELPLVDLLQQSVSNRFAGYEDFHDTERLSRDLTLRGLGSKTIGERGTTLTTRLHTLDTEMQAGEAHSFSTSLQRALTRWMLSGGRG